MISLKLKEAYNNLDLDDKRNKLSNELLVMEELLKNIQNKCGLVSNFKIKNYESGSNINEEEFLSFIYDDLFEIQKQLILITQKHGSGLSKPCFYFVFIYYFFKYSSRQTPELWISLAAFLPT